MASHTEFWSLSRQDNDAQSMSVGIHYIITLIHKEERHVTCGSHTQSKKILLLLSKDHSAAPNSIIVE